MSQISFFDQRAVKLLYCLVVLIFTSNGYTQEIALRVETLFGRKPFNVYSFSVDDDGVIYYSDYRCNEVSTYTTSRGSKVLAGDGYYGFLDGSPTAARFDHPWKIARDPNGTMFIIDVYNYAIRKITPAGQVTTVAGDGNRGYQDGPASSAKFGYMNGLALGKDGSLYISEQDAIRKIDSSGVVSTLYTVTRDNNGVSSFVPADVAVDGNGIVYTVAHGGATIYRLDSGKLTSLYPLPTRHGASTGDFILTGLQAAQDGTLYVSALLYEDLSTRIWKMVPGQVPVALGEGTMALDSHDNVYLVNSSSISKISRDGLVTSLAGSINEPACVEGTGATVRFSGPLGIAKDTTGNLYIADSENHRIRKISATGEVSTFAGSVKGYANGIGPTAQFNRPTGIARDKFGDFYVTDTGNHVLRYVLRTSDVGLYAGTPGKAGYLTGIRSFAMMDGPTGIAINSSGDMYIADTGNGVIRIIPALISTRLGALPEGDLGYSTSLFFDQTDTLYLNSRQTIKTMSPTREFQLVAGDVGNDGWQDGRMEDARFNSPQGMAMDSRGMLYVADSFNGSIRMITPSGLVRTVAGDGLGGFSDGRGWDATFSNPYGIVIDDQDRIYITDTGNHTIRRAVLDLPPGIVFLDYPDDQAKAPGSAASFKVIVAGVSNPVYAWERLRSGATTWERLTETGNYTGTATPALRVSGVSESMNKDQFRCVVVDTSNSSTSPSSMLVVATPPSQAVLSLGSNTSTLKAGETLVLNVSVSGTAPFYYYLYRGDLQVQSTNQPPFILDKINLSATGTYHVIVTNATGSTQSNEIEITIQPATPLPLVTTQPTSITAERGSTASFSITASGSDLHYQWLHEGFQVGSDFPVLTLQNVQTEQGGNYYVKVSNSAGTTDSSTARLTVLDSTSPPPTKLVNISTRSFVGSGSDVMIAGFIIGGASPKTVLIRASGPALLKFAVPGVLADPTLELHDATSIIATNDNWGENSGQKTIILSAAQSAGAFPWDEGSKDAAILITLNPGIYTAIVAGKNESTGVGLVEVYEIDQTNNASRLVNLSTRSVVKTDANVQIAGFIIAGNNPKKVVVRASGPALTKYGVPAILLDPIVEIHQNGLNSTLSTNDNWDEVALRPIFKRLGIDNWDTGSKDAGVAVTLNPGAYTAVVSGKNNTTGVALIEVYDAD